jgi:hypothetical protein
VHGQSYAEPRRPSSLHRPPAPTAGLWLK